MWYPDWPLRRPGAPSASPAQAVDVANRVVACNELAADLGVTVGMRRREAEAICPSVVTIEADPEADTARFEPVVLAVESLIPRVEVASPGLLFVPLSGAVRYFGGEAALVTEVDTLLGTVTGAGYRLGVAAGPFAAGEAAKIARHRYLVEDDAAFLASLDISSLGKEELSATFRWLGITTLGDLARLPRAAVLSRFGPGGLEAHRLADGEDRTTVTRAIPPDLAAEERFAPPLEQVEQAAFAARQLAHRLMDGLTLHGAAPRCIDVEVEAADGTVRHRTWRGTDPFDEASVAERVRWQLAAWLDQSRRHDGPGIRGGVTRLRIVPTEISDEGRQLALHEDAVSAAEAQRSLVRAQALLGIDGLLQSRPQGGRDPADRVAWYRWGQPVPAVRRDPAAPWPGSVPSPTPALVPPEPVRLEVEWDGGMPVRVRQGSRWVPVLSWAGPWRRMGRWWEGEDPADRYQLVTSGGALLCERRNGAMYLTGVYD